MKYVMQGKGRTGPGGIKCPCCTRGTATYVKQVSSRWRRQNAKKKIKKELASLAF